MSKIEIIEKSDKEKAQEAKHRIETTNPDEFKDIFDTRGIPPGMEPFWGNTKREMLEMAKYRDKYVVVDSNTAPNAKSVARQADGTHVVGDAILMMRPKEVSEQRHRELAELLKSRKARSKAELHEMAAKLKIKITDDERS